MQPVLHMVFVEGHQLFTFYWNIIKVFVSSVMRWAECSGGAGLERSKF